MKFKLLDYSGPHSEHGFNVGDDIQTLAMQGLVENFDGYISREHLNNKLEENIIVPMNGFFLSGENWPPSENIIPIFYSFHIRNKSEALICSDEGIEYLKKWQPIGCRDIGTMKLLEKYGVEAYYSKCVTLTFPKRVKRPQKGKTFIVGLSRKQRHLIPQKIREDAIVVEQSNIKLPIMDGDLRRNIASQLLEHYKNNADLVITTKIHAAMPCIAMGIPVVFLYEKSDVDDYRVKIIESLIGINYIDTKSALSEIKKFKYRGSINWMPEALNIEEIKKEIVERFQSVMNSVLSVYSRP